MIEHIIVTSLATVGLYLVTEPDYIGYPLRRLLEKLPHVIYAPLLGCVTCMGSVWGAAGWIALDGQPINLPFFMLSTAFLNTLFYLIYDRLQ